MRKIARVLEVAALCILLSGVGGGLTAQEPSFGGYSVGASAATTAWAYDQPSMGVPASPTMEINGIYTESVLGSGPSAYALSSLAWPGQVAANVGGFVWSTFWLEAKRGGFPPEYEPAIPPPNYPVRAETFYPQGPEQASSEPVAGMQMRAHSTAERSEALAAADRSGFETFVTVGNQTSRTRSELADGMAVSTARAVATDVSLLGGLVTIDAVTTEAFAASDAAKGEVGGSFTVSGMVVDGHPVRIDAEGIHADGEDYDSGFSVVQQAVSQSLAAAGITFAMAEPVDLVSGASASRSVGGLIVSIEAATFREYVAALPAPLRDAITANVAMDQSVHLTIAGVAVRAAATPGFGGFDLGLDGDIPTDVAGLGFDAPGSTGSGFEPGADGTSGFAAAPPPAAPLDTAATTGGSRGPVPEGFGGLSFWLVAAALIAAALTSRALARHADTALAARGAGGCPLDEGPDR